MGPARRAGEGAGVAAPEGARRAAGANHVPGRGPAARAPRSAPGARRREPRERRSARSPRGAPRRGSAGPAPGGIRTARRDGARAGRRRGGRSGRDGPGHPARGADQRIVAAAQGLPAVRVRLLRPLEEPFRRVVRDVDLRQPDEEPNLSTATGSVARGPDLAELIGGTVRALVVWTSLPLDRAGRLARHVVDDTV